MKLRVICSCYHPTIDMLFSYLLNFHGQTYKDVALTISHDGPNEFLEHWIDSFYIKFPHHYMGKSGPATLYMTDSRLHNDETGEGWGHFQKATLLQECSEEFIKFDNMDNYTVPRGYEIAMKSLVDYNLDFVYWDIVHNYENVNPEGGPAYSVLRSHPRLNAIDVTNFIVRTEIGKKTGWNHYGTGGDGLFVQEIVNWNPDLAIMKLPNVLGVHN